MPVPVLLCIGLGRLVSVVGKALQLCGPQLLLLLALHFGRCRAERRLSLTSG